MAPRPRHVIWDWNGTLLDDAWLCVEVMNALLTPHRLPPLDAARYQALFSFPVRDYYRRLGFDFDAESFDRRWAPTSSMATRRASTSAGCRKARWRRSTRWRAAGCDERAVGQPAARLEAQARRLDVTRTSAAVGPRRPLRRRQARARPGGLASWAWRPQRSCWSATPTTMRGRARHRRRLRAGAQRPPVDGAPRGVRRAGGGVAGRARGGLGRRRRGLRGGGHRRRGGPRAVLLSQQHAPFLVVDDLQHRREHGEGDEQGGGEAEAGHVADALQARGAGRRSSEAKPAMAVSVELATAAPTLRSATRGEVPSRKRCSRYRPWLTPNPSRMGRMTRFMKLSSVVGDAHHAQHHPQADAQRNHRRRGQLHRAEVEVVHHQNPQRRQQHGELGVEEHDARELGVEDGEARRVVLLAADALDDSRLVGEHHQVLAVPRCRPSGRGR